MFNFTCGWTVMRIDGQKREAVVFERQATNEWALAERVNALAAGLTGWGSVAAMWWPFCCTTARVP